jgi:VacB/RNase II family 3'-5' exoribonuclease
VDLQALAADAMRERGLDPEFPAAALAQADRLEDPALRPPRATRDLTAWAWCSIDNDDTRDIDQLTVSEDLGAAGTRVFVAVADVEAAVPRGSPMDDHARQNTTSVYTAAQIFPMLPERLSTGLTSLVEGADRLAVVAAFVVDPHGRVEEADLFPARVRNQARLVYEAVASWLEGGATPPAVAASPDLAAQLRRQDDAARRLRALRHERGALELETIEARPVLRDGHVIELRPQEKDRARQLVEDFMIAANEATARFLQQRGVPSLRRVVRQPARWDRLQALAETKGFTLPAEPDAAALAEFLRRCRAADPLRFPDLSLAVVKLLGAGEYVVHEPGTEAAGHFGLAVRDYTHSTAPNRRYPDLITQRLVKALLAGAPPPYAPPELQTLAVHCTRQEDAANRVERQVRKAASAMLLSDRLGESFDALVTGASPKAVWVRTLDPPVEGRVMAGEQGLDVGDAVRVRLVRADPARGEIDFARD